MLYSCDGLNLVIIIRETAVTIAYTALQALQAPNSPNRQYKPVQGVQTVVRSSVCAVELQQGVASGLAYVINMRNLNRAYKTIEFELRQHTCRTNIS